MRSREPQAYHVNRQANFGGAAPYRWQAEEDADVVPSVRTTFARTQGAGNHHLASVFDVGKLQQDVDGIEVVRHVDTHAAGRKVLAAADAAPPAGGHRDREG